MGQDQVYDVQDASGLKDLALWAAVLGCLQVSYINTPDENLGAGGIGLTRLVVSGESYQSRSALPPAEASKLALELDRRFPAEMIDVNLGSDL
jgi:hypothetical protein